MSSLTTIETFIVWFGVASWGVLMVILWVDVLAYDSYLKKRKAAMPKILRQAAPDPNSN